MLHGGGQLLTNRHALLRLDAHVARRRRLLQGAECLDDNNQAGRTRDD